MFKHIFAAMIVFTAYQHSSRLKLANTNVNLIKKEKSGQIAVFWMKGIAGQSCPQCSRISHKQTQQGWDVLWGQTQKTVAEHPFWLVWPCDLRCLYVVYSSELYKHACYFKSEGITTSVNIFCVFLCYRILFCGLFKDMAVLQHSLSWVFKIK